MATWTLFDGTVAELPDTVTDEEAINILAKAFPEKAALQGIAPDVTREYDMQATPRRSRQQQMPTMVPVTGKLPHGVSLLLSRKVFAG